MLFHYLLNYNSVINFIIFIICLIISVHEVYLSFSVAYQKWGGFFTFRWSPCLIRGMGQGSFSSFQTFCLCGHLHSSPLCFILYIRTFSFINPIVPILLGFGFSFDYFSYWLISCTSGNILDCIWENQSTGYIFRVSLLVSDQSLE